VGSAIDGDAGTTEAGPCNAQVAPGAMKPNTRVAWRDALVSGNGRDSPVRMFPQEEPTMIGPSAVEDSRAACTGI